VALCVPEDDGITVHCPTQWVDFTQTAVAQILNYPAQRLIHCVFMGLINALRPICLGFYHGELKALQIGREYCEIFVVFKLKTSQSNNDVISRYT